MRTSNVAGWALTLVASLTASPSAQTRSAGPAAAVPQGADRLSPWQDLSFEPNEGQFETSVRFASRGNGYTLFLTDTESVLSVSGAVVRLALDNAVSQAPAGVDPQPGVVNYLIGRDPSKWRTGVRTYAQVRYEAVYPGIDLVYHGRNGAHEYDFIVAPGADPSRIALRVTGADDKALDASGNLVLQTTAGRVTMRAPSVYQVIDGTTRAVAARYAVNASGRVGFELGAYDRESPLVIDPELIYGTFLGGSGNGVDQLRAVARDGRGAVYIVGSSETTDYPTQSPLQSRYGGAFDAVITKLTPDGLRRVYATYLGGSAFDGADDVDVRADGVAYIVGSTSSGDFPVRDAYQTRLRGSSDAFVVELAPDGDAIVRSTYLGGGDGETAKGIELARHADEAPPTDDNPEPVPNQLGDLVFVYGSTTSPDFPAVAAAQSARAGERDGFLTAFDRQTMWPVYSTYAGQTGSQTADSLVVNQAKGDVYLLLQRTDDIGPLLAHFRARQGAASARSHTQGAGLGWDLAVSAYIAGRDNSRNQQEEQARREQAKAASLQNCKAVEKQTKDLMNQLFLESARKSCADFAKVLGKRSSGVNGKTAVSDEALERTVMVAMMPGCLPTAPSTTCTERAVLVLYDESLKVITHVNFGGTRVGREFIPTKLAADKEGRWHIIGRTSDMTLPVLNPVQGNHRGSTDGFVLTLEPSTGETSFFSYLGGATFDTLADIVVDDEGNRWIVGDTQSADLPVTRSGLQPDMRGRMDGFVVKITP